MHLVVRESDPLGSPGIVLKPLSFLTDLATRRLERKEFGDLVERVRHPALWAPASVPALDRAVNTLEFFVHHEDIRRAQPDWQARELTAGEQKQLWKAIGYAGRGLVRPANVPVTIRWDETGLETTLRSGDEGVVVTGDPGELALFLFGREQTVGLAFDGPAHAVTKLKRAGLGI